MISSTDISYLVRNSLLAEQQLSDISIVWSRKDYDNKEIVIIPHYSDGESSIRTVVVMVNIHVPDIFDNSSKSYEMDVVNLDKYQKLVFSVLKKHVIVGTGMNWYVKSIGQPIKEPEHDEHFVSITIFCNVRKDN